MSDTILDLKGRIFWSIGKARGITALLGHANSMYGEVPDDAISYAALAACDLLDAAEKDIEALFNLAKGEETAT